MPKSLRRHLFKPITILLLPHASTRTYRIRMPMILVILLIGGWAFSLAVALAVSGRHIHYQAMRLLNAHLTAKNLQYAEEVAKAEAIADRLRPLEQELQRALAKTRRAARTGTGVGGPYPRQPKGGEAALLPEEIPRRVSRLVDASGELFKKYEGLASFAAATPSGWPMHGWVTSEFGERISPYTGEVGTHHEGIDIACKRGTPIVAAADGMVVRAGWNQGGYGKMIEIVHGYGYSTRYGHCSRLAVSPGQSIRKGETIGFGGATGNATGPHLHYEVRLYGVAVNPRLFMK